MVTKLELLFSVWICSIVRPTVSFGTFDEIICERHESASCSHQLSPECPSSFCSVKYINDKECPTYSVAEIFNPKSLPFQLVHYIDATMNIVALNLTMSIEASTTYYMHFANIIDQNDHMCRSFLLAREALQYGKSVSWDCLMFAVTTFEGGLFELELLTDNHSGGRYSFVVPMASSQTKSASHYKPFLFLHNHLFTTTGKLYATIQAVPFPVASYDVSIMSCMSQDSCTDFAPIRSFVVKPSSFITGIGEEQSYTLDLGFLINAGYYSVSVQAKSASCLPNCAMSFSPIIVIDKDTGQYVLGILLIFVFISTALSVAVIYKMRKRHLAWVTKVQNSPVTVLFVYHAENLAIYAYLLLLAEFLEKKCHIKALLIDRDSGEQNPNKWTANQLRTVKCVLFFCPEDQTSEGVMPIRNQYSYAIALLEAQISEIDFFKCCQIRQPWSSPVNSKVVQSLKSFTLQNDFAYFLNWIHKNSFLKYIIYWKPLGKEWQEYLKSSQTSTPKKTRKIEFEETNEKLKEPLVIHCDKNEIDAAFDNDIKSVNTLC